MTSYFHFIINQQRNFSTKIAQKLFTPGPLSVSNRVREAMMRDVGTRHQDFIDVIRRIRSRLVTMTSSDPDRFECVPIQGSGTSALEATFMTSLKKPNGKTLVVENGAYGKRLARISRHSDVTTKVLSFNEDQMIDPIVVGDYVTDDVTAVTFTHCETSTGVINPAMEIARAVKARNRDVLVFVDAMSSFGAVPIYVNEGDDVIIDYMVSSANKCLQGVPGFSYVIANRDALDKCKDVSSSITLDLHEQLCSLKRNEQFRFTFPTHVSLALLEALDELDDEGGIESRFKRYRRNADLLLEGMTSLGFRPFLDPHLHPEACIITSFHFPPNFDFERFYARLSDLGDVIYPGQVSTAECFRIGTIGDINAVDVMRLLSNIKRVCAEIRVFQ